MTKRYQTIVLAAAAAALSNGAATAQDSDLAQELANPISSIISFPLEYDANSIANRIGPDRDGTFETLSFSPVFPVNLDNGAAVVTRAIFSYSKLDTGLPGLTFEGWNDILLSSWYSDVTEGGLVWGLGGVVNIPTGSETSTDTWAAGPSAIALRTSGPWTYGILAHHLTDIESDPETEIEDTFLWPWVSYTTPEAWTFSLTTETTYDWVDDEWYVPVDLVVSKLTEVGGTPINWQLSLGYWADAPANGPEGARVSLMAQFVVPK